ncbi:MAG: 2-hydroxyacid dehydrogenase [Steroidobacteraceae bacterium]
MRVLLLGEMAASALDGLEARVRSPCEFIAVEKYDEPRVLSLLEGAEVLVGSSFTRKMAAAAKKLRLVQSIGAGVEGFDLDALPQGVVLANTHHHEVSIAEYAMFYLLSVRKQLQKFAADFKRGHWADNRFFATHLMGELKGKTLGLIGFGHIGQEIAAKARAFSMNIQVIRKHGRAGVPDSIASQLDFMGGTADLNQVLSQADFVVLCCPLNEETRGLIGATQFSSMKPTAHLVNVARGPVVDEQALYQALASKRIAGAAIDVWYTHPSRPPDPDKPCFPSRFPFHELDNVFMTPYIVGWGESTVAGRLQDMADNIDRVFEGKPLKNVVGRVAVAASE